MPYPAIIPTAIPAFVAECELALRRIQELGVTWKGTRFGQYKAVLDRMASLAHPRTVNLRDPSQKEQDRLYREASSQFQQLIVSQRIWGHQEDAVLASKLQAVMKGATFPAQSEDWDPARNALHELATGALLSRHGFDVRLTKNDEDLM